MTRLCVPVGRPRLRARAAIISELSNPPRTLIQASCRGEQNGTLFFVMEYIQEDALFARMRAGRLPVNEILRIASQVVDALELTHKHNFVHRDLKPVR
jgi:serine/threonine-protein kinase